MFRVRWADTALNGLADLWTRRNSQDRAAITRSTHLLDQELQADPLGQSESRPDGRRISFNLPLGVIFRMEADGETVAVLRVWLVPHRKKP